jgi:hypothetical protein
MAELNQQLVLMHRIYLGAEIVHVDLGDVRAKTGMGKSNSVVTFTTQAMTACIHRRLAVTNKVYVGLVSDCAAVEDSIYVFSGVTVPFIMQQKDTKNHVLVMKLIFMESWTERLSKARIDTTSTLSVLSYPAANQQSSLC